MGSEQRNAIIAVVLSGLILFGWQYFFPPTNQSSIAPIGPATTSPIPSSQSSVADKSNPISAPVGPATYETYNFKKEDISFDFDGKLSPLNFSNAQTVFNFEDTVGVERPMGIEFDFGDGFKPLSLQKTSTEHKYYDSVTDSSVFISLKDEKLISFNITSTKPFKYRFTFNSEPKKLENAQERVFAFYTDELNRVLIGDEEKGDRAIKWAGIDFNYHLFGFFFDEPKNLIYKTDTNNTFTLFSNKAVNNLDLNLYFVKKEYNFLTSLGGNLNASVDFGIWGFFAVWILKGLQFFHTFVPNYGISIILLTLLIRLLTFPLQYKSFVSMKKVQQIQPELAKIRENFKNDPQRMQKESMDLFKRSGANPLGGCLPLLLQMPVFFAFYKVLYGAVELVGAPFIFWIQDLSNKDPFYVLPFLMTVAMFLQQKLTPNTISDPTQKKVMLFMPLVFGFIMKDLPSGLSLYIFVSTIFGIAQQLIVFNSKKDKPVVI